MSLLTEKRKEQLRENQRKYRQQKVARGLCARNGCYKKAKYYYCKDCGKIEAARRQRGRDRDKAALKEIQDAFQELSDFKGSTLLERALSARKYFEATESAIF